MYEVLDIPGDRYVMAQTMQICASLSLAVDVSRGDVCAKVISTLLCYKYDDEKLEHYSHIISARKKAGLVNIDAMDPRRRVTESQRALELKK